MADSRASDTFDWSRVDAMSDDEIEAAALADPDNPPLTDEQLVRMRPAPMARWIRMRMKLSQEAFAQRFGIPVGTLRDWEQGRKAPDAATRAYLTVIAQDPDAVARALEAPLGSPSLQDDHRLGSSVQAVR
jgi:putative transcriptional regulator